MYQYFSVKQNLALVWLTLAAIFFSTSDVLAKSTVTVQPSLADKYVGVDKAVTTEERSDLEEKYQLGYTQLLVNYFFAAARTGDVEVLAHFVDSGFPIDQRNSESYTALMVAAYHGQQQATAVLLEQGANACLQDKRGNTAIMAAVIKAEFEIIKQLYRQECETGLTNKSGMTLEEFARYWGQGDKLKDASVAAKKQTQP